MDCTIEIKTASGVPIFSWAGDHEHFPNACKDALRVLRKYLQGIGRPSKRPGKKPTGVV